MAVNVKKAVKIICMAIVLVMGFAGCRAAKKISPSADDISVISSAAGFLAGKVEKSGGLIAGEDQDGGASDCAYLYDNAVAAVALSRAGAHWHAGRIADAIVFAQKHDRAFQDGRLRNAYISGDPKSDSGRSIAAGKVTVRLPGFWKEGRWHEDSYAVATSTGNMAWAIVALCAASDSAASPRQEEYLAAAERAAGFVLTLRDDSGGFTAGYEGWDDAQVKVSYKTTAHNLNLICAFSVLAAKDPEKAEEYRAAADHAKAFVLSMYDRTLHCFYTGTEADGKSVSRTVIPLDANSLAVLVLGDELDEAYKTVSFVEERMAVGKGFDFSAGDLDGIWNEGTAQMAVCYSQLGNAEKQDAVMAYLKTQTARDGSIPAADRDGVSTGFVVAGSEMLWEYNNAQSISATAWLALAQMNKNPFERA